MRRMGKFYLPSGTRRNGARNILLKLEYCGKDFSGWQVQNNARTVQGVLQDTIEQFLRHEIKLTGSGRTDAGVHALAQYANFKTISSMPCGEIAYRLNRMLPKDVVVLGCRDVSLDFDARRSAMRRNYRYQICERLSAVHRQDSWVLGKRLDISILRGLARLVGGARQFENFCKTKSKRESSECIVFAARWSRSKGFLVFEIAANRFLHNMVRLLVGTMVAVLDGKVSAEHFGALLKPHVNEKSKYIAPSCGLYLTAVEYERGSP